MGRKSEGCRSKRHREVCSPTRDPIEKRGVSARVAAEPDAVGAQSIDREKQKYAPRRRRPGRGSAPWSRNGGGSGSDESQEKPGENRDV